jgi:signal peptidase I
MTRSLDQKPGKTTQPQPENFWIELGKTLGTAFVLAILIRTFVAEARYIPSSSMENTLQINDRLIINKFIYRFHDPKRGDIAVFMAPKSAGKACQKINTAPKDAYIKRVIGLPGDKVEVNTKHQVLINNQVLTEQYIKEPPDYSFDPIIVPPNSYLMLGDNRNNSCDGHLWGFLPRENFIGPAVFLFWPLNRLGMINQQSGEQPTPPSGSNTNTVKSLK